MALSQARPSSGGRVYPETRSFYGFAETVRAREDGYTQVNFECVSADWFDRFSRSLRQRDVSRAPVLNLVFAIADRDWRLVFRDRDVQKLESQWRALRVDGQGLEAQLFETLTEAPADVRATIEEPSPETAAALESLVSMDDIRDSTKSEIETVLDRRGTHEWCAVYDVGQGNCNAICTDESMPIIYLDFGGGYLTDRQPDANYSAAGHFCFSLDPPIVLSHWHGDHWYSAEQHQKSQEMNWIVPRQKLGARAWKLVSKLAAKGNLHIWPAGLTKISNRFGVFQRCDGTPINDSGLALLVEGMGDRDSRVLLPADCRYRHVPHLGSGALDGLVAMHHGSHVGLGNIPVPANDAPVAFSCGSGNRYGHPSGRAVTAYIAEGWVRSRHFGTPSGHVGLGGKAQSPPILDCGGDQCALKIVQI